MTKEELVKNIKVKDLKAICKAYEEGRLKIESTSPGKKYGYYGWVKLTDQQYEKLLAEAGSVHKLDYYINLVDSFAERNGNKHGYKRWMQVIGTAMKDGWGHYSPVKTYTDSDFFNVEEV